MADRFVVLRDGRNAGERRHRATRRATRSWRLMVGAAVEDLYPRSARRRRRAVLEVDGLGPGGASVHPAPRRGPRHRRPARRRAHASCCARCSASSPCASGRVRLGAYAGAARARRAAGRRAWASLSEDRKGEGLALGLCVADNLTLSRSAAWARAARLPGPAATAAARRWIDALGIRCAGPRQPVGELSGGNQQKVALARLLHHDVDVLLLDEPTRGIDVASKAQIYALIDGLVVGRAPGGRAPRRCCGQQLPARAARPLRPHRRDVPRPPRRRRGRPASWTEHALMIAASRTGGAGMKRASAARAGRAAPRACVLVRVVFAFLVGPQFFAARQPRAHRAPDRDRLHGRAGHDDGHRRRRHRPVRRLDRSRSAPSSSRCCCDARRAPAAAALGGVGGGRALRRCQRRPGHAPQGRAVHRHAGHDAARARRGQGTGRRARASRPRSPGSTTCCAASRPGAASCRRGIWILLVAAAAARRGCSLRYTRVRPPPLRDRIERADGAPVRRRASSARKVAVYTLSAAPRRPGGRHAVREALGRRSDRGRRPRAGRDRGRHHRRRQPHRRQAARVSAPCSARPSWP